MLLDAHRRTPLKGVLVASPANPTGTMMTREALRELIEAAEGEGIRFISDEIYHGLDYAFPAETAARTVRQRRRHQLVLEIFLHDRLARRLDGGAGAAGAADRPPAGQSRDLGADAVADRGRGGVRRPRRDGGGQARLRGEPPHPARWTAEGRARQVPAGRRRVLSLCRRVALLERQLRLRQAHAGGDPCRGDARRRLRSAARPHVHPLLLRRLGRARCTRRWSGSAPGCEASCTGDALRKPGTLATLAFTKQETPGQDPWEGRDAVIVKSARAAACGAVRRRRCWTGRRRVGAGQISPTSRSA